MGLIVCSITDFYVIKIEYISYVDCWDTKYTILFPQNLKSK